MSRVNAIATCTCAAAAALAWAVLFVRIGTSMINPSMTPYYYYMVAAIVFSGVTCVGWVLTCWTYHRGDDETRCRKCRHILRGLTEPRCPECGESI